MSTDNSEEQWREKLTPEQFNICRGKGTERAFTGKYWDTKTPGTYRCACCGEALFDSDTKYDSGSGWPSFYAPVGRRRACAPRPIRATAWSAPRSMCHACGAHLGHVFPDGPRPTGLRYCINSASLALEERREE